MLKRCSKKSMRAGNNWYQGQNPCMELLRDSMNLWRGIQRWRDLRLLGILETSGIAKESYISIVWIQPQRWITCVLIKIIGETVLPKSSTVQMIHHKSQVPGMAFQCLVLVLHSFSLVLLLNFFVKFQFFPIWMAMFILWYLILDVVIFVCLTKSSQFRDCLMSQKIVCTS